MTTYRILTGDCRATLATLPDASVQCCVTSPPYWGGVRDYGVSGQIGIERDPDDYVAAVCAVFSSLRPALKDDGTVWLNVGDVFAASGKGGGGTAGDRKAWESVRERKGFRMPPRGYKMKDLTLVPFQVADALRRGGWYLRQTIVWRKPAAVEPMRLDRPATSHEYVFLLSKSEHYAARNPGHAWWGHSVWDITANKDGMDHPAVMPLELATRCILAGSRIGDTILDPFAGAGTTGVAALGNGRSFIGCEANPAYVAMAQRRLASVAPLFATEVPA